MLEFGFAIRFLLALLLGAAIGLERESHDIEKKVTGHGSLGVRTLALVSGLGAIAGFLHAGFEGISILITATFFVLLVIYYTSSSKYTQDVGLTTEIATIITYLLGFFLALAVVPAQVTIALAIVLLVILSRKREIGEVVGGIKRSEINAFISYALLALVILPFLPNRAYLLSDIPYLVAALSALGLPVDALWQVEVINPFRLWLIVALITGVDMAGYILERRIGKREGLLLTSMAAGFISSTATTFALARESGHSKATNKLVGASLMANMVSFLQIVALLVLFNGALFAASVPPVLALIVSSLGLGVYFLKKRDVRGDHEERHAKESLGESEIFSLSPALKFAILFMAVRFAAQLSLVVVGEGGVMVTTALGALVGLDAVVVTLAELSGRTIDFQLGVLALVFANAVNLGAKVVYSWMQGSRAFSSKFAVSVFLIALSSFVAFLFF